MIDILAKINAIFVSVQALLDETFLPLNDDQREVVEVLGSAAHDLEALWMPIHFYQQLLPQEQSRWHHDLSNPLNGLIGLSELLLLDHLPNQQREFVAEINQLSKAIHQHLVSLRTTDAVA